MAKYDFSFHVSGVVCLQADTLAQAYDKLREADLKAHLDEESLSVDTLMGVTDVRTFEEVNLQEVP